MAAVPMQPGSGAETALHPKLPLRLERFTLCEELGSGGMATVYLARMNLAAGLERLVALKTIHPHLAKERPFVDMFLDEARIASHVSHPNVCAVYDFGEMEGVYYLAMEHLIGEPLFDVINRIVDRFDDVKEVLPYVAARVIADAGEGLHAAHTARGPDGKTLSIVHRDVSPQNLFVTYDGAVKVVDFGCAKAAQRVAHTSTGVMKGKVGYAAPEQLRAEDVDQRADVWALGVCLWEALTLSPLFTKDTAMSTAMSVLEAPIQLASSGRDWVPEQVAKIADKALQRNRKDRYANARDMGRDLRKFIADSGYTLEAAELAEWMGFLFEDKRVERERQVARVRELDITNVEPARPELLSHEDVVLLDGHAQPTEVIPTPDDELEQDELEEERPPLPSSSTPPRLPRPASITPPAPARPAGSRRWIVALAAIALLGVGAYYVNLYYEPAPWFSELLGIGAPRDRDPPPIGAGSNERAPERTAGEAPAVEGDEDAAREPGTREANEGAPEGDVVEGDAVEGDAVEEVREGDAREGDAREGDAREGDARPRRRNEGGNVTTVVSGGGSTVPIVQSPPPQPNVQQAPLAEPPPELAGGTGSVRIETSGDGWAEVYLHGRRLGRTPLTRELPVGRHRLRVLPYGLAEHEQVLRVDVEAGLEQSLTIEVSEPPP